VTHEVLPAIRKTGSYSFPAQPAPKIENRGRPRKISSPNYALASGTAALAAQAVFEAVNRDGAHWLLKPRLLLTLNRESKAQFKAVDPDAFIMTMENLIEMIEQGGGYTSQKQLTDLAQACLKQIACYWQYNG